MRKRIPAEVFPPGEFLREELEARGWTQADLAAITGLSLRLVNEIMTAKRSMTPETARALGEAMGTSADVWMNLESAYRLAQVGEGDSTIARRAKLYQKAPVREMMRRHWIEESTDWRKTEKNVLSFFEINTLDDTPNFLPFAARKRSGALTPAQLAWLFRAQHLAEAVDAKAFTSARFEKGLEQLQALLPAPEEVRHVPRILANCGIRFVLLEALRGTRIDGACFWLNKSSPAVVLSLRYDRIDCFWFTLMHELKHIKEGDSLIDINLVGQDSETFDAKSEREKRADRFAQEFLIKRSEMDNFIDRVRPLYYKEKIRQFAHRIGVHPGIVVGQLQFRREITWAHNREMLSKIRKCIVGQALTDGWGHTVQMTS